MNFEAVRAAKNMAEDLGRIHAASWQAAYKGIVPDSYLENFTTQKRAEVFRKAMAIGSEEYYLFKADGCPAGLALLHKSHEEGMEPTDGEIYAIYVHPDYWGTPITGMAIRFCVDRLTELGYSRLFIWVLEQNIRARRFYEKHGFLPDGKSKEIEVGETLIEIRYKMDGSRS